MARRDAVNRHHTDRGLATIVKGAASHRRLQLLDALDRRPDLTVGEACEAVGLVIHSGAEHVRKLVIAGLIKKKSVGRSVRLRLTPRGKSVIVFLRRLG